ncbi:MAG TPA: DUF523 domain-containing protein [Vulgatibacter sp.]
MEKILISACLLGERVRYDGRDARAGVALLDGWREEGRLVAICPEVAGGLPVPRPAAEIVGGRGAEVWAGSARVVTAAGDDVTAHFLAGARAALALARRHGVRVAVLKERSPSCGSSSVHDGSFAGRRVPGMGVTTALLRAEGVQVFSDEELEQAAAFVEALERR